MTIDTTTTVVINAKPEDKPALSKTLTREALLALIFKHRAVPVAIAKELGVAEGYFWHLLKARGLNEELRKARAKYKISPRRAKKAVPPFAKKPAGRIITPKGRGDNSTADAPPPATPKTEPPTRRVAVAANLSPTGVGITKVCAEVCEMLLQKNAAYGDSALAPLRVFSKADTIEQLRVRIDDKLSRLFRGQDAGEDAELDLIGYLVLLRVAKMRGC